MKYKLEIQENITLYQIIEILKIIAKDIVVDDNVNKINSAIKKHFKKNK